MALKICLISPYPPQEGGISEYCKSLSEELSIKATVAVLAQAEGSKIGKVERINGILVVRAWKKDSILTPLRLFRNLMLIRPDIVHIQYESYGLYGIFDFLTTPLILLLLRIARIRTFVTLHSLIESPGQRTRDLDYVNATLLGRTSKYLYQVLRTTIRLSLISLRAKIIVHSDLLAERIKTMGVKSQDIAVIPIGTPRKVRRIEKSEAKGQLGLDGEKVILFFGFISASKRISDLITAFRKVLQNTPHCVTIISGVPSAFDPTAKAYYGELKNEARWTNRIIFIDRFIPSEEVDILFSAADLFVLTYSIVQGSSAALALAIAYGLPVIVPEGGTSGLDVKTNAFGLVYARGDTDSLAKQIVRILSDESMREKLSERAQKVAGERAWNTAASKTSEFYCG